MTERITVYLVPGLLCDATIWRHQLTNLSDLADAQVPELRGYDRLEAMAGALLASAPRRFALVGHSMGARIALEVCRQAPDRVERLALLDTGTHGVRPQEPEQRAELVRLARDEGMTALADAWLPPMLHAPARTQADILGPLRTMVLGNDAASFERQVAALLHRRESASLLPQITCPTLIGVGRHDSWSPPEQHAEMAAAIRGAEYLIFEDAGHMAPIEAPSSVTQALRNWLERPNLW